MGSSIGGGQGGWIQWDRNTVDSVGWNTTKWAERPREEDIQHIHHLFKTTIKKKLIPQTPISEPFFLLLTSLFPAFIINATEGTDLHFGLWKINSMIKISVPEWWKQLRQAGDAPVQSEGRWFAARFLPAQQGSPQTELKGEWSGREMHF